MDSTLLKAGICAERVSAYSLLSGVFRYGKTTYSSALRAPSKAKYSSV